jgi:ribonucleoside-diphosphate reductase beta chain
MTVFNADNFGYVDGHYPLFLGPDLGLTDTINVSYPELDRLYMDQISQIWNEFEVDLTHDRIDMLTADPDCVDLMVENISWQHLADSVANRSITGLLMKYVTNSELEAVFNVQALFETIHTRTYSHIIKQTFADPTQMLEDTYKNQAVLKRSKIIVRTFDELENLPHDASRQQIAICIVKCMTALFGLEGIAFMASFGVTFAITDTGIFQGIGQDVKLICRDEVLHTRMDYEILTSLMKDLWWADIIAGCMDEIKQILDEIVAQEVEWAKYLFSTGKQLVGLNAPLLIEYVYHNAAPAYATFGLVPGFEIPKRNPLPYMNKYIDGAQIQSAAQEIQLTSYKVGAINDDTDDLDLDMDLDF